MSDLHLGAENSILTNLQDGSWETDTTKPSPVLVELARVLREVISKNEGPEKPVLVLNGDLMELALTSTDNAARAFMRFVEVMFPEGEENLFADTILFLAGNHDHNLWERSRNLRYNEYLDQLRPGEVIRDEKHCTDMLQHDTIHIPLLNVLARKYSNLKNVNIQGAYPAYAVLSENKHKAVIFCHGHYVESMYSLMTSLRSKIFPDRELPAYFEDLEKENYAWVDFFWSTLGRSGSVGRDIGLIYDKLQDPQQVQLMINNLAENFTPAHQSKIKHWIEKGIIHELLEITVGRMASNERNEPDVALTPDAENGLRILMERFVLYEFMKGLDHKVPQDVTFLFGHTHKPFTRQFNFNGYQQPVKVFNSGGWVVDTMHQQPLHGGSVLLVDDTLDVVALNMYREGNYHIAVEEFNHEGDEAHCPFYFKLQQIISDPNGPWAAFEAAVKAAVEVRYSNLAGIAKSNN